MPTLKGLTQSDRLTLDHLTVGVVETVIERGAKEVLGVLPFKSFEGSNYDFVYEATIPSNSSIVNPYATTDLPEGVGTVTKVTLPVRQLGRNADTPKIDVIGKSNINDQRAGDIMRSAKKLGQDFVRGFVLGTDYSASVTSYQLRGLDYWVDYYDANGFTEQDFDAGGGALSLDDIVDLLSRQKGNAFNVVYAPRLTMNAFRGLLNDMPGNTAEMVMDERFGKPVLMYDGIPWVTLDSIESDKTLGASDWTIATNAITHSVQDDAFFGFSQSDIGKTVTAGTASNTVDSWTDSDSISLVDGTGFSNSNALVVDGDSKPVVYGVYMDEEDGVAAVYHRNLGDMGASMGEHYGPIGGFSATEIGLLEGPNIFRTRLDAFLNVVSHNPRAIVRMRNFSNS